MASSDNLPQLPKNQSAISTNGVVSRDWYRFFLNLVNKVNAGGGNGTGTVTSVAVSGGTTGLTTSGGPITTNGTITLSGTVNVANGGTGLTSTPTNGQIDIGNGTGFTRTTLTAGSGVSITNGAGSITISSSGGGGSVTAVTGTTPISSSGGTTPNISLDANYGDTLNPYASKTANYILAAPDGSAGVPTFRAVVAADIPTLNQNTTGTAGSVANALTIGTGLGGTSYNGSAPITITNTGVTSLTGTASQVNVSASTGSVTLSLPSLINVDTSGNAGTVTNGVYTTGSYADPTWITSLAGSKITGNISGSAGNVTGVVAVLNGGTGQTSYTDGQLLIGNSTGNTLTKSTLTAGTGISITNGGGSITINATNAGAVTSVTGTSPVVSSGGATPDISLASGYGDTQNPYASKTANYFLAAPNGTAGVPTFRAVVPADIPTLNQNTTGTAGSVANALTAGTGISYSSGTTYDGAAAITINNSAPMVYPGAGIPNSTGTAWGASYTTTGSGTVLVLATSPSLTTPILGVPQSGDFSTGTFTWPTFNQNTTGTAGNVTGVVAIANGGTGQTTAVAAFDALSPTTTKGDLIVSNGTDNVRQAVGTDTYVLTADSTTATGIKWAASSGAGATITNDTTTATNLYPTFAAATSGSLTTIYTGDTKLLYKPSTGELTSSEVVASNGIFVNSQTVSANYTVPAGSTAISGGPITVASGISVTVSSGARWVTI
jgi:hypothetical protein